MPENPRETLPRTPERHAVRADQPASIHLFEGFRIDGSYAYLNTKVISVSPVTLPATDPYHPAPPVEAGDPLVLSPRNKFTVTATYTLPLDESIGQLSLGATFTHSGGQVSNYSYKFPMLNNGVDIGRHPSYDLLNLNLNWNSVAGSPVDLAVFVTTVTKESIIPEYRGSFPARASRPHTSTNRA